MGDGRPIQKLGGGRLIFFLSCPLTANLLVNLPAESVHSTGIDTHARGTVLVGQGTEARPVVDGQLDGQLGGDLVEPVWSHQKALYFICFFSSKLSDASCTLMGLN